VQNVTFTLKGGEGLGVIGPSASGKTTLARALVGAWLAQRGTVRLDGAALAQWPSDVLGAHIGYLPQETELYDGTVASNIARFEPDAPSSGVIVAAKLAGVHDMILHLPEGYDTRVGDRGSALSAGQRQRVALARALYGAPFLIVLDEPNSNLDAEGDAALTRAILSVRERNGIVIVIAHRPSALAGLDKLMVLANGQVQAFGPKDEVLRQVTQQPPVAATNPRLKVISDAAATAD
jgi:ATP-binding cassette subfamily C protein